MIIQNSIWFSMKFGQLIDIILSFLLMARVHPFRKKKNGWIWLRSISWRISTWIDWNFSYLFIIPLCIYAPKFMVNQFNGLEYIEKSISAL